MKTPLWTLSFLFLFQITGFLFSLPSRFFCASLTKSIIQHFASTRENINKICHFCSFTSNWTPEVQFEQLKSGFPNSYSQEDGKALWIGYISPPFLPHPNFWTSEFSENHLNLMFDFHFQSGERILKWWITQ